MKKLSTPKHRKVAEMASEYRFDYKKAKPNRFATKMKLNVGWTVEKFVAEEKKEPSRKAQGTSGKKKEASKKSAPAKKAKPVKKKKK